MPWEHGIVSSSRQCRFEFGHPDYTDLHTARSSNGRGRRSDKAETKVRLLLGLLKRRPSDASSTATETDTTPIRGRGVTAAQRAFNSHGGGSNPSGLNDQNYRPVAQRSEPAPYKGQTTVRLRPGPLKTQHGIEVLAAAYPALNRVGDGSSPSGPTENGKHWSSSGEDSAFVMRQRGFESHLVLFHFH